MGPSNFQVAHCELLGATMQRLIMFSLTVYIQSLVLTCVDGIGEKITHYNDID